MSPTAVDKVELDSLQGQYDECARTLAALNKALGLEVDPVRKVQYEARIEDEKRRLEDVSAKMTILKLGDALLRLDYAGQVLLFRNTVNSKGVAAFLVRPPANGGGEADDSIRLLVKRLLTYIPDQISTPPLKVRLGSKVRRSDTAALWRLLAKTVGPSDDAGEKEVAQRVAERLRTQNVLLIFRDLDRVDLGVCMRDFWAPLARAAQQAQPDRYRLILMLVDYGGQASLPRPQTPTMFVRLPDVRRFPKKELATWITGVLGDLPIAALPQVNNPKQAVTLLVQQLASEGRGGGPDPVLWEILKIWQCPWGVLDKWLEA